MNEKPIVLCGICFHPVHATVCTARVGRLGEWTPPSETKPCGCGGVIPKETP